MKTIGQFLDQSKRPVYSVGPNATVKPCVIAYGITLSPNCVFAAAKEVVAVAATVFNSASFSLRSISNDSGNEGCRSPLQ